MVQMEEKQMNSALSEALIFLSEELNTFITDASLSPKKAARNFDVSITSLKKILKGDASVPVADYIKISLKLGYAVTITINPEYPEVEA